MRQDAVPLVLLLLLLSTVRASLLPGIDHHGDHHHHHHDDHDHHHDDHAHHHHDDHAHHHHEFPLATGDEAALASVRINELFNGIFQDNKQLPRDMPAMNEVPTDVQFSCIDRFPGYYADVEYDCQVYHVCRIDHPVASFLCPNGTVFNQSIFTCDWWFNVDCSLSPSLYPLNGDLYKEVQDLAEVKQRTELNNDLQAKSILQDSKDSPDFSAVFQEEDEQAEVTQETNLTNDLQTNSILQANKATHDFSAVFQGLSPPDEAPEGSENVEALVLPLTPQFIIPIPPSPQVSQKNLNQLAAGYLPPKNEYLPPTNDYLPPTNEYLPPTNEYLPPTNEYLPPKNEYLPPTKEFISPPF